MEKLARSTKRSLKHVNTKVFHLSIKTLQLKEIHFDFKQNNVRTLRIASKKKKMNKIEKSSSYAKHVRILIDEKMRVVEKSPEKIPHFFSKK